MGCVKTGFFFSDRDDGSGNEKTSTCAVGAAFEEPAKRSWEPHVRLSDPTTIRHRNAGMGLRAADVLK